MNVGRRLPFCRLAVISGSLPYSLTRLFFLTCRLYPSTHAASNSLIVVSYGNRYKPVLFFL